MAIFTRLDRYATDDPKFHKPRHGICDLCNKPVIDHPCWRHRFTALLCLIAGRVLGLLRDLT